MCISSKVVKNLFYLETVKIEEGPFGVIIFFRKVSLTVLYKIANSKMLRKCIRSASSPLCLKFEAQIFVCLRANKAGIFFSTCSSNLFSATAKCQ